jgi:hypothetical protein
MKKIALLTGLNLCLGVLAWGQVYPGQLEYSKVPVPKTHYQQEYTFDTTVNKAAWTAQKAGLHVSFGSTDRLYMRSEVPQVTETLAWEEIGWRGERLNAQVLVWSPDTLQQVRFVVGNLVNEKGTVLNKGNLQLNQVRYVVSNYPYGAKDVTCGASPYKNLYLMPDRFESFERFEVPGKTVRPVWLALEIPRDAQPGTYSGIIEVKTQNSSAQLKVKIRVQDQVLPRPYDWKHRLDLWQNPWVIARYNQLEPWSEQHKSLLKQHLKLYAEAGGKFITTYAVHSPWADNSYMIEETMIEWIKQRNGSWKFDYKIFDEYVQMCIDAGIDKAITIYTPVPWGNRFRYLDESTGNYVHVSWAPETQEFRKMWNILLTDLKAHLEKKGWMKKTYLGINENAMEQTLAAIKVIKDHSKDWKITYAGNWHKELNDLLDDYCFLYGQESTVDIAKQRAAKGMTTTYYVCCNPPVPNNFVFSPPVEGRWISWYTAAHQYDGFLRWAYDAWPADPVRDARHELWPAGDCYLVYPGAQSGIRYEKLREGIVDFEKIRILKEQASKSTNKEVKALWQALEKHLNVFLLEKDFNTDKIITDVNKGKQLVHQLSERLTQKV